MLPDKIENLLHVAESSSNGDDSVLSRQDDAKLTEGAVTAVSAVATAPELEAIALLPIRISRGTVIDLEGGSLLDPVARNKLLTAPHSFLEIELTKASDVSSGKAES